MEPKTAMLLRVFVGEQDRFGHEPLYEAVVLRARDHGLAGATVFRGMLGFGASSTLHTTKILRLTDDLPIVIEIVDAPERIESFLPVLDGMLESGLVIVEKVGVLQYGTSEST